MQEWENSTQTGTSYHFVMLNTCKASPDSKRMQEIFTSFKLYLCLIH